MDGATSLHAELSALAIELAAASTQEEGFDVFSRIVTSEAYRKLTPDGRDWLREHSRIVVAQLPRGAD
jgi:hypothetical protein